MKIQNIYKEWKRNSLKFSKFNIFEKNNIINLNNEIFLREYKYFYVNNKNKKKPELLEYAIWIDDLNIAHIRESKNIFIDGTWYKPKGFCQLLIIQYKDIITKEQIVGTYIIMNKRKYYI
jgi:hypothetical protein